MAPDKKLLAQLSSKLWIGYEVSVTPNMAREWLEANRDNRRLRPGHVASATRAMLSGEWMATHQGIAFTEDGRLVDGQHRLTAVCRSGATVPMVVFLGCPSDTFRVLDTGARRGLRDLLMKDGRVTDQLGILVRLESPGVGGNLAVSAEQALRMLGRVSDSITALNSAAGSVAKGRTQAGFRAGVTLRHACGSPSEQAYIESQWKAWVNLDVPEMARSISALLRRLDSVSGKASAQTETLCLAWIAFNPASQDLQKIIIRDTANLLNEMRVALARLPEQEI